MVKLLTTQAHIEAAKCSFAAWTYCSKTDTRLEGPVHFGEVPKPKKKKASSYKEYNQHVLEDLESMVEDGRVNIKEYAKLKQC